MLEQTRQLILIDENKLTNDQLRTIMREMTEASNIRPEGVQEIDNLLRDTDPSRVGLEVIITLLRFHYRARDILPHWRDFRDRSALVIASKGKNPEKVLMGLYTTEPAPDPYRDDFARMMHAITADPDAISGEAKL